MMLASSGPKHFIQLYHKYKEFPDDQTQTAILGTPSFLVFDPWQS